MVERIEIDTNYDGATFAPEVALDYSYEVPAIVPTEPALVRVDRTDIAAASIVTLFEYSYLKEYSTAAGSVQMVHPRLLTGIRVGRLDDQGQPFDYATFAFADPKVVYRYGENTVGEYATYRPAILSEHFGGADRTTFEMGTYTGALGRAVEHTLEMGEQQVLSTAVQGIAAANSLATNQSYDYTPGVGEPEGYVYDRIERNGSRTTFTRDAQGRVLTKTEDADGTAPRMTSYTWTGTTGMPATRTTSQMSERFSYTTAGLLTQYTQEDVLTGSPDFGKTRTWDYTYTTLASGVTVIASIDGPGLVADGVSDVTAYAYDTDGNLASITDPNGLVTAFLSYNAMGLPTLVRQPDTIEWGFDYDINGRVTQVTY